MRTVLIAAVLVVAALAAYHFASRSHEVLFEPTIKTIETPSPCAWNNADAELINWFPHATGYAIRDVPLSGKRLTLQERLGRPLFPEEMALHSYAITNNTTQLATVLTRRIKAEHGAIELALALDAASRIEHFKIQSSREPQEIINALSDLHLESRLNGKTVRDQLALDLSHAPPPVQKVALQITEAIKTLLILQDAACGEPNHTHH